MASLVDEDDEYSKLVAYYSVAKKCK